MTVAGPPAAIILAGGRASRLGGADKAQIEIGGMPLIDSVCAAVAGCAPIVIAGPDAFLEDGRQEIADLLLRRLDGAVQLKEARLLMLRAGRDRLEQVLPLLPGGHEPTLMPVEGRDEVAVQMLVHGSVPWGRLEELKRAGAHNLLVLPVEGMLA